MSVRSITETPNVLSADIDLATPEGIVRILRQTDAQIFSGYQTYAGLYDASMVDAIWRLAQRAAQTIMNPKGCVVLSGAGTSGRLAVFAERVFNQKLGRDHAKFRYLIAGGDAAFMRAQEGAEDDPLQAQKDLREATLDAEDVFYVGITCGFSAPYIAGQLEEMLETRRGFSVLLGFNPLELARTMPIEGWPHTFRDAAEKAAKSPQAALLNPIIGPEPVTGSTRMKSGSATKILVEALFNMALLLRTRKMTSSTARRTIVEMLRGFEQAHRSPYVQGDALARLIALGGAALKAHRHIYYLGGAGADPFSIPVRGGNAAVLGIIDASECPPTFGAAFTDVRGFVRGGWDVLLPHEGKDLSALAANYPLSLEDFERDKLPELSPDDLCVFLGRFEGREKLLENVKARGAKTAAILWDPEKLPVDAAVLLDCPVHRLLGDGPLELAVKLVLNALTTGAHILAGKVYGNRMIDLRISNNKLFHRTVGIISDLMKVSQDKAIEALLRSVYESDWLHGTARTGSIRDHIEAAKSGSKVVPKALLIATGEFTYQEADAALRKNPIVRAAIQEYVKS